MRPELLHALAQTCRDYLDRVKAAGRKFDTSCYKEDASFVAMLAEAGQKLSTTPADSIQFQAFLLIQIGLASPQQCRDAVEQGIQSATN